MKKESKDNEFDFSSAENQNNAGSPRKKSGMSAKRKAWIYSVRALMTAATGITLALALFLVVYVLAKGLPNLSFDNGTELSVGQSRNSAGYSELAVYCFCNIDNCSAAWSRKCGISYGVCAK